MKKKILVTSVLFALGVLSNQAHAVDDMLDWQENETDDDFLDYFGEEDFVSIATGSRKSLNKAPAVASVVTAEMIEKSGATYLDEVLELIPGLHVSPSTVSRLDPVYSIRGLQTGFNPQVLVLLNGTEFKNSFSGGLPFTFRLPSKNIERVEVIRGPGSALYGADAFSGVINIVTKDIGNDNEVNAGARLGSFSSRDVWLQAGTTVLDDVELDFSFETQKSDGDPDRIVSFDTQSLLDQLEGTNVSFAPGPLQTQYNITNLRLGINWQEWKFEQWYWEQDDGGLGSGGANILDPAGTQNVRQHRSKLSYQSDLTDDVTFSANASHLVVDNETFFILFPPGTILGINEEGNFDPTNFVNKVFFPDGYIGSPESDNKDTRFEAAFEINNFENHEIRIGFGWFKQDFETSEFKNFGPGIIDGTQLVVDGTLTDISDTEFKYLPDSSRTNRHMVLQDIWQIGKDWEITLGVRYDDFSDFGSTTNPRVAIVWAADHDITIKALYGSAFRAPSFNDQFLQNNPAAIGNPNLKPEDIDTFEIGLNYQINFNTKLALNFYSYEADDLIVRVSVPGNPLQSTENQGTLDGQGVEFELHWAKEDLSFDFNFAHQQTEDPDMGNDQPFVAENTAYFGAFYDINDKFSIASVNHWISGRKRAAGDDRDEIDDYVISNLTATYHISNKTKTKLIIKNIFDEEIFEPSTPSIQDDIRMPTRSIWLEVESTFNF